MRTAQVRLQDFRGLKDIEPDFGATAVLVGENDSGRTSVPDALRLCLRDLGPRRRVVFDRFDFRPTDGAVGSRGFGSEATAWWSTPRIGGRPWPPVSVSCGRAPGISPGGSLFIESAVTMNSARTCEAALNSGEGR